MRVFCCRYLDGEGIFVDFLRTLGDDRRNAAVDLLQVLTQVFAENARSVRHLCGTARHGQLDGALFMTIQTTLKKKPLLIGVMSCLLCGLTSVH